MKVTFVAGYMAPRYGGPPLFVGRLAPHLRRMGVTARIVAPVSPDELQEIEETGWEHRGWSLLPRTWPRRWHRSRHFTEFLTEIGRETDLFHLQQVWDYPVLAASNVAVKLAKPYVLTPHGIFSVPWRYNTLKKRAYLALFGRRILTRAACIHAVAPNELEGIRAVGYSGPVAIIPNGINPEEFDALPPPAEAEQVWPQLRDRRVVLALGRLSPEKGLDLLVRAMALLVQDGMRPLLVLAGPDHNGCQAALERLAIQEHVREHILFTGYVSGEARARLLGRADIFVQCSYTEGCSNSILEALAAGKPCVLTVGTNFPHAAEVGAAIIVQPEAGHVAQAIRAFCEQSTETLREIGGRGAQLVAAEYTWKRAAERLLEVYTAVLNGQPPPAQVSLPAAPFPTGDPLGPPLPPATH